MVRASANMTFDSTKYCMPEIATPPKEAAHYPHLDAAELAALASLAEPCSFKDGEIIFHAALGSYPRSRQIAASLCREWHHHPATHARALGE